MRFHAKFERRVGKIKRERRHQGVGAKQSAEGGVAKQCIAPSVA